MKYLSSVAILAAALLAGCGGLSTRELAGRSILSGEANVRHVYFVQPDASPFLIMQGDKDPLVPLQQSELLRAALQKAGVESHLQVLPGAGHGGGAFNSLESLKRMADFFDKHLLQPEVAAR